MIGEAQIIMGHGEVRVKADGLFSSTILAEVCQPVISYPYAQMQHREGGLDLEGLVVDIYGLKNEPLAEKQVRQVVPGPEIPGIFFRRLTRRSAMALRFLLAGGICSRTFSIKRVGGFHKKSGQRPQL